MLITLFFFKSFFFLTRLQPNGLICGRAYSWSLFCVIKMAGLSAGLGAYARRNTVSLSNHFVIYSLPTAISSVIENHRYIDEFVFSVDRELQKSIT